MEPPVARQRPDKTADANTILVKLRALAPDAGMSKQQLSRATGLDLGYPLDRALDLLAASAMITATGQTKARRYAVTGLGRSIDLAKGTAASPPPAQRERRARGESHSRVREFRCGFWGDGRLILDIPKIGHVELTPQWTAQVAVLFGKATASRPGPTAKHRKGL
jgi:hypothetical protein